MLYYFKITIWILIGYFYVKCVKYSKLNPNQYFERIYGIWHVYKF